MRKFEPQSTSEPFCRVVSHNEHCDCGVDPDAELEAKRERREKMLFKEYHIPMIRNGSKTVTRREWDDNYHGPNGEVAGYKCRNCGTDPNDTKDNDSR